MGAAGSLNSINAVLPEDYRVIIDTKHYEKSVQNGVFWVCKKCGNEVPSDQVKFIKLRNNSLDTMHYKEEYSEHWVHSTDKGCGYTNRKSESEHITERKQEPFYLGCVWEPPLRKAGLDTRFGFKNKFQAWFYQYQKELEHTIGRYRADYKSQNPDDEEGDWEDEGLK